MRPLLVVVLNEFSDGNPGLSRAGVFFCVHLLVYFTSPQYTDLLKEAGVRISMDGKNRAVDNILAALVAVPDFRFCLPKSQFGGFQDEFNVERLFQLPTDDVARIPIDDGHQVHPAVLHPDVGNVDPPHVVVVAGLHTP